MDINESIQLPLQIIEGPKHDEMKVVSTIMAKFKRKYKESASKDQSKKTRTNKQLCETDCDCDPKEEVESTTVNTDLLAVTRPSPLSDDENLNVPETVFVDQPSELDKIKNDVVQLAVWRQANPPDFVTTLSEDFSISAENLPSFEGIVTPDNVFDKMKARLSCRYSLRSKQTSALTDDGIDELIHAVEELVNIFAKISESESVNVKLEVVSDNGCAFWHQDCVDFRLVTTYRGPCTDWVLPAFSKATLRRFKHNSKHAKSLSHCDVALFKGRGETFEGAAHIGHPGIVHRSPRVPEGSGVHRLVLVLDVPQEGWHY